MSARNSTSTLFIVCILVFTFPFWIGIAGGMIGLMAGLFGGLIGIVAGFFGIMVGLIALPFRFIFGWGHGPWFHGFHFPGFFFLAVVVFVTALLLRRGRVKSK